MGNLGIIIIDNSKGVEVKGENRKLERTLVLSDPGEIHQKSICCSQ